MVKLGPAETDIWVVTGDGLWRAPTRMAQVAAVALPSAGTAVAFVVMSRAHLIGDEPVWAILVLLLVAALIGESTGRLLESNPRTWTIHLAIGLQCLSVAAIIYAIGWGPTLAIGFLFVAARALDLAGSRAWVAVVVWAAVGTALGQTAIALHLVYSYVPTPGCTDWPRSTCSGWPSSSGSSAERPGRASWPSPSATGPRATPGRRS